MAHCYDDGEKAATTRRLKFGGEVLEHEGTLGDSISEVFLAWGSDHAMFNQKRRDNLSWDFRPFTPTKIKDRKVSRIAVDLYKAYELTTLETHSVRAALKAALEKKPNPLVPFHRQLKRMDPLAPCVPKRTHFIPRSPQTPTNSFSTSRLAHKRIESQVRHLRDITSHKKAAALPSQRAPDWGRCPPSPGRRGWTSPPADAT
jgi:hypothetical protein